MALLVDLPATHVYENIYVDSPEYCELSRFARNANCTSTEGTKFQHTDLRMRKAKYGLLMPRISCSSSSRDVSEIPRSSGYSSVIAESEQESCIRLAIFFAFYLK